MIFRRGIPIYLADETKSDQAEGGQGWESCQFWLLDTYEGLHETVGENSDLDIFAEYLECRRLSRNDADCLSVLQTCDT